LTVTFLAIDFAHQGEMHFAKKDRQKAPAVGLEEGRR